MKTNMALSFSMFALTCLSMSAVATSYSGSGNWKSNRGESGEYTVLADIAHNGDSVNISQILDFGDQIRNHCFVLRKESDGFFGVHKCKDDIKVGQGYCWTLNADTGEKLCHSNGLIDEFRIENTVKITADAIYRMGSKTNIFTKKLITWKDELQPLPAVPN